MSEKHEGQPQYGKEGWDIGRGFWKPPSEKDEFELENIADERREDV